MSICSKLHIYIYIVYIKHIDFSDQIRSNNLSLKYQRFEPLGCKDIGKNSFPLQGYGSIYLLKTLSKVYYWSI